MNLGERKLMCELTKQDLLERKLICDLIEQDLLEKKLMHKLKKQNSLKEKSIQSTQSKKNLLATVDCMGIINIWDLDSDKLIKTIDTNCYHNIKRSKKDSLINEGGVIKCIQFSRNNKYIITEHFGKEIVVWDVESGQKISTCSILGDFVSVTISLPSDYISQILTTSDDKFIIFLNCGFIYVSDLITGKLIHRLEEKHIDINIEKIAVSENGKIFAGVNYCAPEYTIQLWNTRTGRPIKTISGSTKKDHEILDGIQVQDIRFANDDTELLVVNSYSIVTRWDIEQGTLIKTEGIYDEETTGVGLIMCQSMLSHNNKYAAEVRYNKRLKLISISDVQQFKKHMTDRIRIAKFKKCYDSPLFTHDDKKLVVLRNGNVIVIDVETFEIINELGYKGEISFMACSN